MWDAPDEIWTPRDILDHIPTELNTRENFHEVDIGHFCAAVIHPDTGKIVTQYKKLANDPNNAKLIETWRTGFGKEVGRMAQGDNKTKNPGTNCMLVMNHKKIARMHAEGRVPTYARVVVDFRPQK